MVFLFKGVKMTNNEYIITKKGLKDLEERLNYLKTTARQEASKEVGIARAYGDLSENAEYSDAKDKQGMIEAEIKELEEKIRKAEVIDESNLPTDVVVVGGKVKLYDEDFEEEVTYHIVGTSENDPLNGLISNVSPLGVAVLGHKAGETVEVSTPDGISKFKILEII